MKLINKLLTFSLLAVILVATSCGSEERKPLTPTEAAEEFLTALQHLDYYNAQLNATDKSSQMLNMLKQASTGQEAQPKPFKILRSDTIRPDKVKVFFIAIKQPGDTIEPEETYVNVKLDSMTKTEMLTREKDILESKLKEFNYSSDNDSLAKALHKDSIADTKRLMKLTKKLENMEDDGKILTVWLVDYSKESFMEDLDMGDLMGGDEEDDAQIDLSDDAEEGEELEIETIEKAPAQTEE